MSKQYGLILPNKGEVRGAIQRPSIFNDDSDTEEDYSKAIGLKTRLKRQDRILQEKAVEEDPTVFQYDEIYDDMDKKRKESKLARKDIEKKPKYINKLMAAADKRKKENERRIERQVQKEREAEGETFKDKESFVTTAYRKKLEEIKALEEEEKREEYLEAIGDVKRQGNLDGFYRHLYEQKLNYDKVVDIDETKNNAETEEHSKRQHDLVGYQSKGNRQQRKYRKRDESPEGDSKEEVENARKEHLPSNLDADSDFSIDSDSDEIEEQQKKDAKTGVSTIIATHDKDVNQTVNKVEEEDVKTEPIAEIILDKPKIDIWKKRTVGEVYDAALQRYFERKSLRDSG